MNFFGAHYVEIGEAIHSERQGHHVVKAICRALGKHASAAHVLDLGCGYGRIAVPLADRVGSVLGVDLSSELVAEAARRAVRSNSVNARFIVADASEALNTGQFDAVLLLDSVLGADAATDSRLMQTTVSALRPGGWVFASALNLAAVVRHLDGSGRATFVLETSEGAVTDEVEYRVADGTLRTVRAYESGRPADHLVVHLWDASHWAQLLSAYGFADITVSAIDGGAPDLDTPELLVSASLSAEPLDSPDAGA